MQNITSEGLIEKIASLNGIEVYHLKTGKFKTNTINIFFHDILTKENVTKNALVPAVLRRGCARFPTFQDIALYLEELYGSTFDCGVNKKGERQVIQFYAEFVSDKYTGENINIFDKAFDLLYEITTEPVLENGGFKKEYLAQEKENLKNMIEGRVNDKVQYAAEKCLEVMCSEESFGIFEYGSVEDLNAIDEKALYQHYQHFLESLPMDVYITGPIEESSIKRMLDKLAGMKRTVVKKMEKEMIHKEVSEIRNVVDRMSVNQGKLSLGFRTHVSPEDKEYYQLLVYNGVLGGGTTSKLFQNVREKASLAYYAFSRLEKFKGLMLISSGIEIQNKDQAYEIILQQLEDIKSGNISDYEFDSTIKSIETGIKSLQDSQLQMVDFYLSQSITNTKDDFNSIIEKVLKVTKQDVADISRKIQLDTVYFLTSN